MSRKTHSRAEMRTRKMHPPAMMPFTAPCDSPDPSKQKEPNFLLQTNSMARAYVGSTDSMVSSFRLQLGWP